MRRRRKSDFELFVMALRDVLRERRLKKE